MIGRELFLTIGEVRDEWIADAGEEDIPQKKPKRWNWMRRLGAAAACFLVLLTVGYCFVDWYYPMGAHEEVLRIKSLVLHNRLMSYELVRLGEGQRAMLPHRRGEYVGNLQGTEVWHLQGREDYAELIFCDGETWQLGRINQYNSLAEGWTYDPVEDADWVLGSLLSPEEWGNIDTSTYTMAEVLRNIYAADSAEDIAWVRFEKDDIDNTQIGQSVKVKTVTLRDEGEIARVWEIMAGLTPLGHHAERPQPKVALPEDVRAVQVVRNVTVKFKNGAVLEFEYNPAGGEDCALFYRIAGYDYFYLTVEQNRTLIDLAEISFAPTPIPETKPPRGIDATETARPPETAVAAPETIPE
ncbi:MAG: hypothetical protein E7654_04360 [Ruminococcaceae bacterium]|nr:hypothetical protein [Oscillospiraceae bacterium]